MIMSRVSLLSLTVQDMSSNLSRAARLPYIMEKMVQMARTEHLVRMGLMELTARMDIRLLCQFAKIPTGFGIGPSTVSGSLMEMATRSLQ